MKYKIIIPYYDLETKELFQKLHQFINMEDNLNYLIKRISNNFEDKLREVISSCDSPIEKKLLAFIIYNLLVDESISQRYSGDIIFETECRPLLISYMDDRQLKHLDDRPDIFWKLDEIKRKKFNYNRKNDVDPTCYNYRYSGIRFFDNLHFWNFDKEDSVTGGLNVFPQYPIVSHDQIYFADIAIIEYSKYEKSGEHFKETKLVIECDGHEFHSSPEAIEQDNIRVRNLVSNGWKVIRYSGREINRLDEFKSKTVMDEIFSSLII